MKIQFTKYHGCGNDFIIINEIPGLDYSLLALAVCNRKLGIGADGLIIYKEPLEMVFYNADGSAGTMCGNGLRCLAVYIHEKTHLNAFTIKTPAGLKQVNITGAEIAVNLGRADFSGAVLGIKGAPEYFIDENVEGFSASAVYTGTAHLVIRADGKNINEAAAGALCHNQLFPEKINVNFVKIIKENEFYVRTYERGVGWTSACGTGAAAAYALFRLKNLVTGLVKAHFEYGNVTLTCDEYDNIILSGPAHLTCYGYFFYQ